MIYTRVLYDDWEQLYEGDTLLAEGHSIDGGEALRAVGIDFEQLALDHLPNDNFEVDNLVAERSLSAIKRALAEHE